MEKNILIITYWSYNDALIQTYTLPYVKQINEQIHGKGKVYLVTLESDDTVENTIADGVKHIPLRYHQFGIRAFLGHIYNLWYLRSFIKKAKIEFIHTWCTPAGGIGYILALLTRKKLILDSYEPHAEPMLESGTWRKNSLAFKMLLWLEKKQSQKAEVAIACVPEMKEYALAKYGVVPPVFYSKPACINLDQFSLSLVKDKELVKEYGLENTKVCVYAGKFGGSYLTKEVFDFLKIASDYWNGQFKALLLNNHSTYEIMQWCGDSDLDPSIIIHKFVPHEEVPKYMGLGDFGITPFIPVPSKRYGSPIKTGEYWALGLPVVITQNISDNSTIIENNDIGYVLTNLDDSDYLQAVKKVARLLNEDESLRREKIRNIAAKHRNFSISKDIYRDLYRFD